MGWLLVFLLPVILKDSARDCQLFDVSACMQVWLARVPVEDVQKRGLALQRLYSSWDFYREIAAIVWYFVHGWLCSCCNSC